MDSGRVPTDGADVFEVIRVGGDVGSLSGNHERVVAAGSGDTVIQQGRPCWLGPSYPSWKSDWSMEQPIGLKQKANSPKHRDSSPSGLSIMSYQSMDPPDTFKESVLIVDERRSSPCEQLYHLDPLQIFQMRFMSVMEQQMIRISRILRPDDGAPAESFAFETDVGDAREAALMTALHILEDMQEQDLVERLIKFERVHTVQKKHKSSLKRKSEHLFEGIARQGNPALLNKIYTELYITEGGFGTLNVEHEVRQIESSNRAPAAKETAVKCNDIFRPLSGQDGRIRTILTNGVAGIGKTVLVQKFILDWADGKANQDVHFLLPLPFRELNLMAEGEHTMEGLLHCFFGELRNFPLSELENYKVIFIFDGLDECQLPLDFENLERCPDISKPASLEVLLTNLIAGNLLPYALLWITSRPAAAYQLPARCVDRVTEVRGFNDPQKEEYFYKRIGDKSLAKTVIQHVKSSRSLHIMCHIPVFCWISATVLERRLVEAESHHMPKSLTEMYTHFLIFQTVQRNEKYTKGKDMQPCLTVKNLFSLGELAFKQLYKLRLIFYEEDLQECGIDAKEASVYSGVCTQIFKEEEFALYPRKVYSFVHLSFQEYLAAFFVHLCWAGLTASNQAQDPNLQKLCLDSTLFDLHKSALDLALRSMQGHLDLFLRFLLGLSLESNQKLLRSLLPRQVRAGQNCLETVSYIKQLLSKNIRPESAMNLLHCLHELDNHSLVQEIQTYLSMKSLSAERLSPAQWFALVFVLMNSEEKLEVFDLRKYIKSNKGFSRLTPVAQASRTVILSSCNLTREICSPLSQVLHSKSCAITHLDLSDNVLQDEGVMQLCSGLKSPNCRLEVLNLAMCGFQKYGCSCFIRALLANPGHLRELDLSYNLAGNKALSELLTLLPNSKIETLRLVNCSITKEWCVFLASAVNATPLPLKHLDLSENSIGDLGAGVISEVLWSENCKIQSLSLANCNITKRSCNLLQVPSPTSRCLRSLNLSGNDLRDSGVKRLANDLANCGLENLRLSSCGFTEQGFVGLALALRCNPTCPRELDLSKNFPGRNAIEQLCAAVRQPTCTLRVLCLDQCGLDANIYHSLYKTIRDSSLRELSLSNNDLGDEVVRSLLAGLQSGRRTLEILRLAHCSLTDRSCEFFAAALSSELSILSELDLSGNVFSLDVASFLCSISNATIKI